jgi:hypothetical protein
MAGLLGSTPRRPSDRPVPVAPEAEAPGRGGLLGEAWRGFVASQSPYWRRWQQGLLDVGQAVGGYARDNPLETVASSGVPVVADAAGLLADAKMYATDPESRTWGNAAASAAGLLPFMPGAAGIFAGKRALTADLDALAKAQELAKGGADPRQVWSETGWFQGPDSEWRFEIDDSKAFFNERAATAEMPGRWDLAKRYYSEQLGLPPAKLSTGQFPEHDKAAFAWADEQLLAAREAAAGQPVGEVLPHGELFSAYPELAGIPVAKENLTGVGGTYGGGRITYGNTLLSQDPRQQARSTLLHELQHATQEAEGFARGGSSMGVWSGSLRPEAVAEYQRLIKQPQLSLEEYAERAWRGEQITDEVRAAYAQHLKDVKKMERDLAKFSHPFSKDLQEQAGRNVYRRLAGEVEARAVEARQHMPPEQRRASFPLDSYDVPPDQLILRGGLLGGGT